MFYILANLNNNIKRLDEELGRSRSTVHLLAREFREKISNAPDPV
jgi:hypothetical protein